MTLVRDGAGGPLGRLLVQRMLWMIEVESEFPRRGRSRAATEHKEYP